VRCLLDRFVDGASAPRSAVLHNTYRQQLALVICTRTSSSWRVLRLRHTLEFDLAWSEAELVGL
jgi:hypothetical protein